MTRVAMKLLPALAAAAVGLGAAAQEAVLINQSAGGILPLEGERRLEVRGLAGRLVIRQGKAGELRFAARELEDRKAERPVALWLEERVLRLGAAEGGPAGPLWLEVSLPPELDVFVDAADSDVEVGGIAGTVEVRGRGLALAGRMLLGSIDVDLADSDVVLVGVGHAVALAGRELGVNLERVGGSVTLQLEGGEAQIEGVSGTLEGEVDGVELLAEQVHGRIRLEATGGSVTLVGCASGAELRFGESPLQMRGTKGPITIDTDSEVRFSEHDGPLTMRVSLGAAVRGANARGGALEIEAHRAEVHLEGIESQTTIRGDDLDVRVTGIKGELAVHTMASDVTVDKAENSVTVENEFGDVKISEALRLVQVVNRDGAVQIDGLKGPAQVRAEGTSVEVHWEALEGTETSSVENARGDVRVSLPTNVRMQIDAQAPHGRVESDLEELRVSEDGRFAAGILNGGGGAAPHVKRPTIRVTAAGNLYLKASGPLASPR